MRARRSCLSVPGSSPKFLAKAAGLPADEVFFDLEDSVAPLEKEAARGNIIEALKNNTFQAPTKIVRINGVYTRWAYRDIIEIVEAAGDLIDGLMIPKVETPNDVTFVADLLRMIEETTGLNKKLGLEVQIDATFNPTGGTPAAVPPIPADGVTGSGSATRKGETLTANANFP